MATAAARRNTDDRPRPLDLVGIALGVVLDAQLGHPTQAFGRLDELAAAASSEQMRAEVAELARRSKRDGGPADATGGA